MTCWSSTKPTSRAIGSDAISALASSDSVKWRRSGTSRSYPGREGGRERRPARVVPWKEMSYVDLHCHLLPGVDDGAPTMERTIIHAGRLEAAGVSDVACTPHIKRRDFPRVDLIRLALLREEAQRHIDARGIDVVLHGGGELGHDEALLLAPDELELIAQGPPDAPLAAARVPVRGRSRTTSPRPPSGCGSSATTCCWRTPSARRRCPAAAAACTRSWIAERCCRSTRPRCSAATGCGPRPPPSGCSATAWSGAWPPTVTPARATTRSTRAIDGARGRRYERGRRGAAHAGQPAHARSKRARRGSRSLLSDSGRSS